MPMPAPEMAQRLRDSVLSTLIGIIGSVVGLYFLIKHFGSIPVLNRLVLKSPIPSPVGVTSGPPMEPVSGDDAIGGGRISTDQTGRSITELRPTGRAEVDGQIIDVITRGEWIEPDQPVKIIEVHGNKIVVEADPSK